MSRRRCECGNAKEPGWPSCLTCYEIDGRTDRERRVIQGLRAVGGIATTDTLMVETGWSRRRVLDAIVSLKTSGRVLRLVTGEEQHALNPTFVLSDSQPSELVVWSQLVFSAPPRAWVALCRQHELEPVLSRRGKVLAEQCRRCLEVVGPEPRAARQEPESADPAGLPGTLFEWHSARSGPAER